MVGKDILKVKNQKIAALIFLFWPIKRETLLTMKSFQHKGQKYCPGLLINNSLHLINFQHHL